MGPSIRSLVLVAAVVLSAAVPSSAQAAFDNLPGEAVSGAPYASAAELDVTTPVFDSAKFTEETAEVNNPAVYLACGGWGAKDGWVRFSTAVAGNLRVNLAKTTPGDVFYTVYTAPTATPAFNDLKFHTCFDGTDSPEESYSFGHEIPAGSNVFVQALVQCRPEFPACSEKERLDAPGGPTTLRLRFRPANADGDAFPDSIDACPAVAGAFSGCPDSDGDGVGDPTDACPAVFGRGADGCALADEDGDGHAAAARGGGDCRDDDRSIHPAARDVPRNGVDEDCSGADAVHPRLDNEVAALSGYSLSLKRTVGFLAPFKVGGPLVSGMSVRLLCKGRGCPFSRRAAKVRSTTRSLTIGKELVGATLAPGTRVTLVITRPGFIGKAVLYTIRRRGKLKIENLCVQPGKSKPRRKCA